MDERRTIAFLGPVGTFTEQALLTQDDLAKGDLIPMPSIIEVLAAAQDRQVDLGFVPVENAIEGTVTATLDTLAFDCDLLIQREVVIPIDMDLMALPGTKVADIRKVMSIPHATAQCRRFLHSLPGVEVVATSSTAEAARLVGESGDPTLAAVGNRLAAEWYGLEVVQADVADHPENKTRFVVVGHGGIPAATGHDKTTIVVFQRSDRPGSLRAILSEFSDRDINLSKLESRPARTGLGNYCFIIDIDGHVSDEVVGAALRDLHAKHAGIVFLGSYPAAGDEGPDLRSAADANALAADEWLADLRTRIRA